ncbi:MAG TPA: glycosyltransferase family 9 protein [Marmoricola sp.]|nr:glycosyltransferase family 9 protein [Marmoricola sp.]
MVVLRALGLGDFLTAVPALRALRRARPEHQLVLAAPDALHPLAELSGAVDAVHATASLEEFVTPDEPVDIAVNLHGKGPQSHRALVTAGPRELLAFACPSLSYVGPRWQSEEHEVHRWCRLVSAGWGVEADPTDLLLQAPSHPSVAPGAVVVHPGAAYPSRRWPAERFAEVARRLHAAGHCVVVTGSAAERSLADEVSCLADLPAGSVLAGGTDLAGLAGLVAGARLVVSGDTGIAHLASAYRTPSVVLFGPTPPSRWGPPPHGPHVAIWHGTGTGDPWGGSVDPALSRVEVDEVLQEADRLLADGPTAAAGATT